MAGQRTYSRRIHHTKNRALTDLRHDSFKNGLPGRPVGTGEGGERREADACDVGSGAGPEARFAESTSRTLLLVTREAIRNALMHAERL
jgi:hypothetical protein